MSRWRNRPIPASKPFDPDDPNVLLQHRLGGPAPWLRAYRDGRDVTTLPVSEWREYDQQRYASGWRPDRFGDDPATIPEGEQVG